MIPAEVALITSAIQKKQEQKNSEPMLTSKEKLIVGGVIVVGIAGYFGYRAYRKSKVNKELRKSYDEKQPSYYASILEAAMSGLGTDEEVIRSVLRSIPSKEFFDRVVESYETITGDSLPQRLIEELNDTEYAEIIQILATKPDRGSTLQPPVLNDFQFLAWAKRLRAAFDITYWGIPGTDNDAIKAVLSEIPTKAAFNKVSEAFKTISNGKDLMEELMDELEFWERSEFREIIDNKP